MKHHKYLIVGGGMTADSAVRGIRKIDQSGTIAMICDEQHLPYDRPPLSKSLWKDKSLESIWRDTGNLNVAMHLGKKIVAIDPEKKTATDDAGNIYTYEKLLLATGGTALHLPVFDASVIYFRTVDDYQKLSQLSDHGSDFVVIGGGFIGSEIAAALTMIGKHVTMIFPSNGIGSRAYPQPLVEFLNSYYQEKGVTGQSNAYHHRPFFYSDLFDLGYEAVGELDDASLDIVEDWKEPFNKGVLYYLRDGRVRGVLLWNTWGQIPVATRLIEEKAMHTRTTLLGQICD